MLNKLIAILDDRITHPSEWNFSPGKTALEKSLVSKKARAVSSTRPAIIVDNVLSWFFEKVRFFVQDKRVGVETVIDSRFACQSCAAVAVCVQLSSFESHDGNARFRIKSSVRRFGNF